MTYEWQPIDESTLSSIRHTLSMYRIDFMAPTCGATSKNIGDVIHLGARPTGGTAPYRADFYKGPSTGTPIKTITGIT